MRGTAPNTSEFENVTECYYQDFRYPPGHEYEYQRTTIFWNITAARLLFVLLFENTVAIVMLLVRWLIPDISGELRDQIRREAYITNEIIIKQEAMRASQVASARSYIKSKRSWNKLLNNDLTGSQLDLFIHTQEKKKSKARFRKNKTQDFIKHETRSMDALSETKV